MSNVRREERKSKMAKGRQNTGKGPGKGVKPSKTTAWIWTETTEPSKTTQRNIEAAYRVGTAACARGSCRVNCKFNPNCHNGLGEKLWLGQVQDDYWHCLEDPEAERRKKDAFVGLKNLGATCYVNTFLQLWFHNTSLRSAIYHWTDVDSDGISLSASTDTKDKEDDQKVVETEKDDSKQPGLNTPVAKLPPLMPSSCIGSDDKMTNICAHLQLIFAQLQYSCRRYIDPTPLIHCLGLDTAQQQDAQEFSKLFMSLLESTLSAQSNPEVRDVIQRQFGGEYVYVTKCDKCGNKSMTLSQFYELDLNIQGHTSLSQCIKEFLKEEELNGDNQYFCMSCKSKQNAKRYIEIQSLPPVLNLQLLRFVFDRKTNYKKKLNSHVQFPDVLNLNSILKDDAKANQEDDEPLYDLMAVLMHQGTSAYSGHYVAHIRDTKKDIWYKFNDEDTEKMCQKLKLSGEDEDSGPGEKPAKRPRCSKGYHTSRNAYMLVYTKRSNDSVPEADVTVPEQLQELVAKDNSMFEEWIGAMHKMRNDIITRGKSLQASIQSVYEILPVKGKDYEWILTDWLKTWLNDKVDVKPPIDNSSLICSHGKLHPEKAHNAKRVSIKAADLFFNQFGGFPRLQRDSLCPQCVQSICRQMRFKTKSAEDDKTIKAILKTKPEPSAGKLFWIGKTSLQSWKRLATLEEEAKAPPVTTCTVLNDARITRSSAHSTLTNQQSNGNTVTLKQDTSNSKSTDSRKRKTISNTDEDGCATPKEEKEENTASQTERMDNGSCVRGSNKDSPSHMDPVDDSPRLDNSDEEEDVELIKFNEDLLCDHGNLSPSLSCRKLIPASVWKLLLYYFEASHEFPDNHPVCQQCQAEDEDERRIQEMNKTQAMEERAALNSLYYNRHRPDLDDNDEMENSCIYVVNNSFVEKWRSFLRYYNCKRPESILNEPFLCPHQKFMFKPELNSEDGAHEAFTYVFKDEWDVLANKYSYDHMISVTKETTSTDDAEESSRFTTTPEICQDCHASRLLEKARSIENYRHATIYVRKITDEHDPQEIQRRFDEETLDPDSPQDPDYSSSDSKKQKSNSDVSKRRSSRHRKQRGEIQLMVHSSQTLREIKLELMKSFSVMPMDQHLSLKGTLLSDDNATLSRLGVRPGCLLMLKLDQPQGGSHPETFLAASTAPEKGFQGTGLLGH